MVRNENSHAIVFCIPFFKRNPIERAEEEQKMNSHQCNNKQSTNKMQNIKLKKKAKRLNQNINIRPKKLQTFEVGKNEKNINKQQQSKNWNRILKKKKRLNMDERK